MYCASKRALDGFTETLSYELRPLGIHASLVQPGFVKTALDQNMTMPAHLIGDYNGPRKSALEAMNSSIQHGATPEMVAKVIWKAMSARPPRLRYLAGSDAVQLKVLSSLLPEKWFAGGVRSKFGL